jgi:hypothetical protein
LKEGNDLLKKARRFKKTEESESKSEGNFGKIPFIPAGHILYKIKPKNIKKDLIRWRGIYNSEGRIILADELAAPAGNDRSADDAVSQKRGCDDSESQGPGKGRNFRGGMSNFRRKKARRVKAVRRTASTPSGINDGTGSTITVSMKDDEDSI